MKIPNEKRNLRYMKQFFRSNLTDREPKKKTKGTDKAEDNKTDAKKNARSSPNKKKVVQKITKQQ